MFWVKLLPPMEKQRPWVKFLLTIRGYRFTTGGVKRFQRDHRLPVTGIVDYVTLQALECSVPPDVFIEDEEEDNNGVEG